MRQAEIERQTKETYVYVSLNIDGKGEADVDTGVGFMDHMLELLAFHGNFDLKVRCKGDLQVDSHHTVEDLGIVLGQCFNKALDFSGRPYLVFNVELDNIHLGNYEVEMTEEFFRAFAYNCFMTLHINEHYGKNTHHIIEAIFKSMARAIKEAVTIDEAHIGQVVSSKGVL